MVGSSNIATILALLGLLSAMISSPGVCLCHAVGQAAEKAQAGPDETAEPECCCCCQPEPAPTESLSCCSTSESDDGCSSRGECNSEGGCGCCVEHRDQAVPATSPNLDLAGPTVLVELFVPELASADDVSSALPLPTRPPARSRQALLCVWRI